MSVSVLEMLLLPLDMPREVEALVSALQRSVPFEGFDPNGCSVSNTYVGPDMRIARVNGDKFVDVLTVFERDC